MLSCSLILVSITFLLILLVLWLLRNICFISNFLFFFFFLKRDLEIVFISTSSKPGSTPGFLHFPLLAGERWQFQVRVSAVQIQTFSVSSFKSVVLKLHQNHLDCLSHWPSPQGFSFRTSDPDLRFQQDPRWFWGCCSKDPTLRNTVLNQCFSTLGAHRKLLEGV